MILFYSETITPRIEYIVKLYFGQILQVKVLFSSDKHQFQNSDLPKINYSDDPSIGGIYMKPYSLLFETEIKKQRIQPVENVDLSFYFESSSNSFLSFDLFAAAFYIVTRYEEYHSEESDQYGRFNAEESILFKLGLLKKPVINIWAEQLAIEISKVYPEYRLPERKFRFLSTVDVDNAWAFRNKNIFRTCGALLKALLKGDFTNLSERIRVLAGVRKDLYDNYEYLDSVFEENESNAIFFFLLGNYGRHDKGISFRNRHFRKLIAQIAGKYKTGIHPSYASAKDESGKLQLIEKQRLEEIAKKQIEISRQHYLKISFPATFRKLVNSGIKEDYSLGYSSQTGFRAGICTPFFFYDLEKEITTDLKLIPFQVMDVTLQQYLRLNPDQAWLEIQKLMEEVKEVRGTFVSVWHNESVNDLGQWKGYREVFEKMNQLGFQWGNE